MAKPVPEGFHTVTPYLNVTGAAKAIEFYALAFGAQEVMRMPGPDGSIMHAEIKIGNSHIMMSDENPAWGTKSPTTLGGTTGGYMIYVEDCDAVFDKAVAAGATVMMPCTDQFYGDRCGTVLDPFGHKWSIATHKKDMTPAEMGQAFEDWMKGQAQ
jgi:PhnB protein